MLSKFGTWRLLSQRDLPALASVEAHCVGDYSVIGAPERCALQMLRRPHGPRRRVPRWERDDDDRWGDGPPRR